MAGSPIKFGNLSKDFSNPRDKAWREGKSAYAGSIGPNKDFDNELTDQWAAKWRDSPVAKNFYTDSYTFPGDVANAAQAKIDSSVGVFEPAFTNPGDNEFSKTFLKGYLDKGDGNSAEGKGLIEEDRIVRPDNLAQLSTTPATSASAERDINVAGRFPSQDVSV